MAAEAFRLARAASGTLVVSGTLGFATAAAALREIEAALRAEPSPQLDLAAVTSGDSAGLACLLAVLAGARERGQALRLQHVPESLRTLAQVSGVAGLLGAD